LSNRNRNKKKGKGTQPKKAAPISENQYTSKCCSAPATKTALVAVADWKSAKVTDFGGLGKFRCTVCKKRCVVNRSKLKAEEKAQ
jgi:uncharacterized Fe-S radical SAM superfamily protein PflX